MIDQYWAMERGARETLISVMRARLLGTAASTNVVSAGEAFTMSDGILNIQGGGAGFDVFAQPDFPPVLQTVAVAGGVTKGVPLDFRAAGHSAGPVDDARRNGLPVDVRGSTAIIPIMGPTFRRASAFMRMFGIGVGTEDIQAAINAAVLDEEVHTILLRIDSPGGTVNGLAELADTVASANVVKPVIAQVEGVAFSAAFWVASQATSIFAGRGDLVGSIGVVSILYDLSVMFEKEGIRAVPIVTGKMKAAGALGTEVTKEQEAAIQALVDSHMEQFVQAVTDGRGLTEAQLGATPSNKDLMSPLDAGLFPAEAALELGLIDGIRTIEQTLNELTTNETERREGRRRSSLARAHLDLMSRT